MRLEQCSLRQRMLLENICSQLNVKLLVCILHPAELGNSDVCKPKLPLNDAPCRWPFKVVLEVSV